MLVWFEAAVTEVMSSVQFLMTESFPLAVMAAPLVVKLADVVVDVTKQSSYVVPTAAVTRAVSISTLISM
jgi:hypothetical protein